MRQVSTCILKFNNKRKARNLLTTYERCRYWSLFWVGSVVLWLLCVSIVSASLRPVVGARALGMSGAFISGATDSTGALWNPAGLASLEHGSLVYDLSQGAVSFGYPIHYVGTLGFSALDLNGEDRFFHDHPNNPVGTFERGYNQILLSYARSLGSRFQLGGNLGYNRAPNPGSQWKPSYDLGAIVKLPRHLILGARLIDISGVIIPDREGRLLKQFDQTFAVGAAWKPVQPLQLNSVLDTALWQLRVGGEVGAYGLALRLGTAIDLIGLQPEPDWSMGFSVNVQGKHLHYAYLTQPDVAYRHLLAVGLTFDLSDQPVSASVGKEGGGVTRKTTSVARMTTSVKGRAASTVNKREIAVQGRETTKTESPPKRAPDNTKGIANDTGAAKNAKSPTEQIAKQYGVEVDLILALVKRESTFNPKAISPNGAVGLMQLMPAAAQDLGLEMPSYQNVRKPTPNPSVDERFHPLKNLDAGVRYLHEMLKKYDGDYGLSLAAYHAGSGNVRKTGKLNPQTERHVGKVLKNYYQYKRDTALKNTDLRRLDAVLR